MPYLGQVLLSLIARLRRERQELSDNGRQPIHAVNHNLELLPILRVKLGNFRCVQKHRRHVAEMPTAVLMQRSVPMVVIAERTRTTDARALPMKPRKTVVALHGVRHRARCRWSHSLMANAGKEFVIRWQIILGSRSGEYVLEEFLPMRLPMIRTVPRQIF